jgi:hypothetical protein
MKFYLLIILLTGISYCHAQSFAAKDSISFAKAVADTLFGKDAIKLFPNPAVGDVYITIKQTGVLIKTLFVFDVSGNKMLERKINSVLASPIKFSVSNFPAGNYFVVAETNKNPIRLQLIKN